MAVVMNFHQWNLCLHGRCDARGKRALHFVLCWQSARISQVCNILGGILQAARPFRLAGHARLHVMKGLHASQRLRTAQHGVRSYFCPLGVARVQDFEAQLPWQQWFMFSGLPVETKEIAGNQLALSSHGQSNVGA